MSFSCLREYDNSRDAAHIFLKALPPKTNHSMKKRLRQVLRVEQGYLISPGCFGPQPKREGVGLGMHEGCIRSLVSTAIHQQVHKAMGVITRGLPQKGVSQPCEDAVAAFLR